ncbi:MAG: Uncharacterized protein JWN46_3650 [Acidimicrobiales bacterium]|nr:Uncharacterized protein [Acidimicrobiales bacterium]
MTAVLPSHVVERAEARAHDDPGFAELLATLVDTPLEGAGELRQVAARELNRQRRIEALEQFMSGALVTSAVQRLLGLGTPQAVHRLRSRGRIIGRPVGNATWFPSWQFVDGQIRADLAPLLERLRRFSTDAVALDRVMRLARDDLGGRSIAEALDRRASAATAWATLDDLAG